MISHHFVKKSLQNNIEKAYKLNKNENKDEKDEEKKEEESKEEKEFGEKIDKNVESSYSNLARQAVGVITGASCDIIVSNTVRSALSLGKYGLRMAGGYALMGAQIIIGPLVGICKMSKNGDEMIKLYKEKFREKNYDCTLALIDSILSGILFFEELLESFNKINE